MSNDSRINAALFNFCLRLDDGPRDNNIEDSNKQHRSSMEDLKWLKDALATMEAPDKTIKRLLGVASASITSEADEPTELLSALEELSEHVEDINAATEFCLMDGPRTMLMLLRNSKDVAMVWRQRIQQRVAAVIAHSSQQNSKAQSCYVSLDWHKTVVPLLAAATTVEVQAALLHACSCMCREDDGATQQFVTCGGMDVVASIVEHSSSCTSSFKLLKRSIFLSRYLASIGVSNTALVVAMCHVLLPTVVSPNEKKKDEDCIEGGDEHAEENRRGAQEDVAECLSLLLEKNEVVMRSILVPLLHPFCEKFRLLEQPGEEQQLKLAVQLFRR